MYGCVGNQTFTSIYINIYLTTPIGVAGKADIASYFSAEDIQVLSKYGLNLPRILQFIQLTESVGGELRPRAMRIVRV